MARLWADVVFLFDSSIGLIRNLLLTQRARFAICLAFHIKWSSSCSHFHLRHRVDPAGPVCSMILIGATFYISYKQKTKQQRKQPLPFFQGTHAVSRIISALVPTLPPCQYANIWVKQCCQCLMLTIELTLSRLRRRLRCLIYFLPKFYN